jgi:leucyl aminopeptidase
MKFQIKTSTQGATADALVLTYFVKQKPDTHPLYRKLRAADRRLVERLFRTKEFTGKEGEAKVVPLGTKSKAVLLGIGERNAWQERKLILVGRRMVTVAKAEKVKSVLLALEPLALSTGSVERLAQTVVENAVMADYEFTKYKAEPKAGSSLKTVVLMIEKASLRQAQSGVRVGEVVGTQVNLARDLGNIPGGEMTPSLLAKKAQDAGRSHHFKVTVLGRPQLKKLGMGAILGVAHGSAEEPKFIIMEHRGGKRNEAPHVFVGKGVTFDTGGLNLKPERAMNDMHLDMLGGAVVIAAMSAAAQLKLPINVVGLVPAVENMPGSAGYRPGDVLRSMSGKTIEVLNTDAEGRIILADALTYAERYKPKVVVDVATLTGACMVALGLRYSGLMTPSAELQSKLIEVGDTSGDYVWPLPLDEDFADEVKGTFGDVANLGKSGYGGAEAGAAFLWQFAKSYPWAHLDIAGPMKTIEGQHLAKGASGVGVRLLVELLRSSM